MWPVGPGGAYDGGPPRLSIAERETRIQLCSAQADSLTVDKGLLISYMVCVHQYMIKADYSKSIEYDNLSLEI